MKRKNNQRTKNVIHDSCERIGYALGDESGMTEEVSKILKDIHKQLEDLREQMEDEE